jgi:phosphate:Na+ symporter
MKVSGTVTLLQLGGYVGLLLWGTHMVSTGIERGFGTQLRRWLGRTLSRPGGRARLYAFLAGLAVTAVLQSSTATGLMVTSFTASGAIGLAPALAVMLGANVGTTLITQILAFNIATVAPVLVLIGVVVFRSSSDGGARNLGRVGIGLGLMLLALGALVHTLEPVESATALRAVLGSLGGQPVLAVLLAAALTWACHSSVAIVLLIGSLAASGVVAPAGSLALVLGANLGSTLPPLFEVGSATARRLPLGNLLVRATGCIFVLPFLPQIAGLLAQIEPAAARLVVNFHTAFNLALAVLFLPLVGLARSLARSLPPRSARKTDPPRRGCARQRQRGALRTRSARRCASRICFEGLLRGAIEVFRSGDRHRAADISRTERIMDRLGAAIRRYLADIGNAQPLDDEDEGARGQEILSAVINLEHAGDIIANNLLEFAARRTRRAGGFAPEELDAIEAMHAELVASLRLGLTVFLRGDAALCDARRLVVRKWLMRRHESEAAALNVRSLQGGVGGSEAVATTIDNSDFLRIVRDLRRVHSHIAALAYPVLEREAESERGDAGPAPGGVTRASSK